MTNLYISLFPVQNDHRRAELLICLNHNLSIFDKVYCLTEGKVSLPKEVIQLPVTTRPTFRTFFNAVNHISGENDINVVANADIQFESIREPKYNQCFALTRYEGEKFLNRIDSQDSWWFKGKINIPVFCDFHLGIPGCDNRIAYELRMAGYEVINPSLTIKTVHVHSEPTNHKNSPKRINQPYLKLNPCSLQ